MLVPILLILVGLVALVIGGELLVRGASLFAAAMQISPLVIGLTVVAFGTSAPELGVSLQAAMSNAADVAIGNVVGSNICNVLLILGMAALVNPLIVSRQLIRIDVPLMIVASFALWLCGLDGKIGRFEGLALFGALVCYIVFSILKSRKESRDTEAKFAADLPQPTPWESSRLVQLGLIAGGLVLLGLGAKWLVDGAVQIARLWEVSELIIGLTIVAIGTSLPEVVTSVVASFRGERDIAVGNVVGSNLFNILCVIGLSSTLAPKGIAVSPDAMAFDIPIMIAVAVICFPIFFTGSLISRTEGALLLAYYVAYTALIVLTQMNPELSRDFANLLGYVAIPLTAIVLLASLFWSWRAMASQQQV